MESNIIITILEMLKDRKYTFDPRSHPDNFLKNINPKDFQSVEDYNMALGIYNTELQKVPFINKKITDTSLLPIDDKGNLMYVYIQEGDEHSNPFNDNQPDRLSITKQIVNNLKQAFPELSTAKKLHELYGTLHLIIVFNGVKRELLKIENEAFKELNFEVWPKYRLRYNVTKHQLQGTITKLGKTEADMYKEKYQVTPLTVQVYRMDDPVVRYYYGQPGDVFHIKRFKGGENYRLVVRRTIATTEKK